MILYVCVCVSACVCAVCVLYVCCVCACVCAVCVHVCACVCCACACVCECMCMCVGTYVCVCMCVIFEFMLQFHYTQNPSCAIDNKELNAEVVPSPQLMQVSGSDIVAMGGTVVQGFHFFMVALQNGTVLQVSVHVHSVCVCACVCACVAHSMCTYTLHSILPGLWKCMHPI